MTDNVFTYQDLPGEQLVQAMNNYNLIIFFNGESAEAYWRRGGLHEKNKDFKEAIEDFTSSLRIDSTFDKGEAHWTQPFVKKH